MMYTSTFLIVFAVFCISCSPPSNPLEFIINTNYDLKIVAKDSDHSVKILYTQIYRDSLDQPHFIRFGYNANDSTYFYPASTVKFPAVLIALEKMKRLGITSSARIEIDSAYSRQSVVRIDSTSSDLKPSILHYAKKIMLVSDNDAYNRLYEFIGQDTFNEVLTDKGYLNTRITHRLNVSRSSDENAHTNPLRLFDGENLLFEQPLRKAKRSYASKELILRGKGYIKEGELISEPFDFTNKNDFSITDQHQMMQAFIYPNSFPGYAFDITAEDKDSVLKFMSIEPQYSGIEAYSDTTKYWDSFVKFLMFGSKPDSKIPPFIKIYNKIGLAYGFAIDNAYIKDSKHNIEFFLTAVIQTNSNEIYNDNDYEYEDIALPFLEQLGQAVYEYELNRIQ